jgi:hypothetical protein
MNIRAVVTVWTSENALNDSIHHTVVKSIKYPLQVMSFRGRILHDRGVQHSYIFMSSNLDLRIREFIYLC